MRALVRYEVFSLACFHQRLNIVLRSRAVREQCMLAREIVFLILFPRLRPRKHCDSRENKTNYFLREQRLSVNNFLLVARQDTLHFSKAT